MTTPTTPAPLCSVCGQEAEYHPFFDFVTCAPADPERCCCFEYVGDNPNCPKHGHLYRKVAK